MASPEPLALTAAHPFSGFSASLTAEEELAEQRPRVVRRQPGRALAGLDHGARAEHVVGVLREQPELDVVPAPQLAAVELARAGQRRDQRRLA